MRDSAYKKAHPDCVRAKDKVVKANAKARKYHVPGSFTVREWLALKAQYNHQCLCCGKQEPTVWLTADHVIPFVKGGANDISNIQPLCLTCNDRKREKSTDYRVQYAPLQGDEESAL